MALRRGLRRRTPEPPAGLRGLTGRVGYTKRPVESRLGEECARCIGGALREEAEDRERRWDREKGERFRGRSGRVEKRVVDVRSSGGSETRRGVEGRASRICI